MKRFILLAALLLMLGAGPALAQAQQPAQPAPAQPAQTPPAAQAQPPRPFPEGAKMGFVYLNLVAQNSTEGRSASTKIEDLQKKKQGELQEKNKQLQAAQQKLTQGGTVLSDPARGQLEKDIERMQREIQFLQQSAQAEIQDLTQDLQEEFRLKLLPVIEQVGAERDLHVIFSASDAGIIWANPGLDVTQEVIRRLDAAAGKPAPKPQP
jgi:Skp family chaperone for outer membrane proteins